MPRWASARANAAIAARACPVSYWLNATSPVISAINAKFTEWKPACLNAGVLRITLPTRDDPPVFVLEGRLAGDWAKELMRVTRDLGPRTTSVFNLEEVYYVDPLGEETLLWLNRLGARFITNTAYGKYLCRRLHLHRTPATNPVQKRGHGKAPPDTPVSTPE